MNSETPNHIPLSQIPPEVFAAAETLEHYFTKQGLRYWEYAAVADRRLVNKLERQRDQLLDALKVAFPWVDDLKDFDKVRAALEAVKGERP